mmetsp:Transcript_32946/g.61724  ORF Transcript_32946/g.61724 Transcript_32946/m.61724 type:complete len:265 (+) Transcript_32946:435-1229(+)
MVLVVRTHRTASRRSQNTARVVVPDTCIDTNGNRGFFEGGGQALQVLVLAATLRAWLHGVAVACDGGIAPRQLHVWAVHVFHLLFRAGGGVSLLCQALSVRDVETVGQTRHSLEVLICALREATIAALAAVGPGAGRAACDLLWRQLDVIPATRGENQLRLDSFRGRKRPAAAALALVLDGRHCLCEAPVYSRCLPCRRRVIPHRRNWNEALGLVVAPLVLLLLVAVGHPGHAKNRLAIELVQALHTLLRCFKQLITGCFLALA